jgi:hypothetical protein
MARREPLAPPASTNAQAALPAHRSGTRSRAVPCPTCPIDSPCSCGTARDFARKVNVRLPHPEDEGRFAGERRPSLLLRQRVANGRETAMAMRFFNDLIREEVETLKSAIASNSARLKRFLLYERVLSLTLDGGEEGVTARREATARALGYKSHSVPSKLLREVQANALAIARERGLVEVICARPGCLRRLPARSEGDGRAGGRRRLYCDRKCAGADRWRRWKTRRDVKRAIRAQQWATRRARAAGRDGACASEQSVSAGVGLCGRVYDRRESPN